MIILHPVLCDRTHNYTQSNENKSKDETISMSHLLVASKPRSRRPIPPAADIPPMSDVGSTITMEKEDDIRAAVIAAAIPPGVAP